MPSRSPLRIVSKLLGEQADRDGRGVTGSDKQQQSAAHLARLLRS
jgi:hypothetical protein